MIIALAIVDTDNGFGIEAKEAGGTDSQLLVCSLRNAVLAKIHFHKIIASLDQTLFKIEIVPSTSQSNYVCAIIKTNEETFKSYLKRIIGHSVN